MPLKGELWWLSAQQYEAERTEADRMRGTLQGIGAALGLAPSPGEVVLSVETMDEILGRVRQLVGWRPGQDAE